MSAAKAAKAAGLPSLRHVYVTANIDRSTFNRWYHHNRVLFDVVVRGVKAISEENKGDNQVTPI